jgi:hypothetical protein
MKMIFFCIISVLLFAAFAQAQSKIVTGYSCFQSGGSSGMGNECVIAGSNKFCYATDVQTKVTGFKSKWDLRVGFEIKVYLKKDGEEWYATKIVATGRKKKNIQPCEPF